MLKRDFFLEAMQAEMFRRKDWVISAFSLTRDTEADYANDPYPYRIVNPDNTHERMYVEPTQGAFTVIDGLVPGEPPFSFREKIELKAGDVPNLTRDITSTYGNVLVNYIALVWPFGNKIPYQEGRIGAGKLESLIEPLLTSVPKDPATPRDPKLIYVDEYLKFTEAMFALSGYTQLCVPSATERTMTTDPRIPELRAKLLKQYEGRLHDPAIIAKINDELVAMDKEWLKGDPGEGFYLKEKSYRVVRLKAHLMHGAESGFSDNTTRVNLIENSLSEGWDIENLPAMANSLREGSYNRGALTALGGEAVKFFYRVMQNSAIVEQDCGAKIGMEWLFKDQNYQKFVGYWMIKPNGDSVLLETPEDAQKLVGKKVVVRSPMYCKTAYTGFCERCMGVKNSQNPTGLGAAASDVGSTFMGLFMKAMHGKILSTAHFDFKEQIT